MHAPRHPRARASRTLAAPALLIAAASACAGGTALPGPNVATEAEWRALAMPRPAPLPGAPLVAVGDVELVGTLPWPEGQVGAVLGISELVVTGLLPRRDVDFVERRRFAAASAAERSGGRPPGAPPAGVSRRAEFVVHAVWVERGPNESAVDVRLVRLAGGEVAGAIRRTLDGPPNAVRLARTVVAAALDVLDEIGRKPTWNDRPSSVNVDAARGVEPESLRDFARGLAAEELWRWEDARRAYERAAGDPDFAEAAEALARTARLRLGGTIAES